MNKKRIPHIHCPVNGWDCPYYTDEGQPCLCTLENPIEDCDDFASMWDRDDDYIDDDWIESWGKKMKINLYVTHYELFNLQNSVPINSEIFWVLGEFLSIIEEEIDKEFENHGGN